MFFELTDLLTCPRCGAGYGLVLLVQEVHERRVVSGWLGCPNCRRNYPVVGGVPDLRLEPETVAPAATFNEDELPLKILALTGLANERGFLLLGERLAHVADAVAAMAADLEVVAVSRSFAQPSGQPGVSRLLADVAFPLAEYRLAGVAIAPGGNTELVAAAARRVASGGRLVLFDASDEDLAAAERSGLSVLAAESGTAVMARTPVPLPG